MTCPSCGATNAAGARFCSSCGQQLFARGDERRVATVLFADLVGFTHLSETRDPEQVKNLVDSCFERLVADIASFGGQVDKIIGDAVIALFGAPVAHEDDAERAVRAALRMHDTLASYSDEAGAAIQMRVGVNTGEVLVGALRAGGDYTAMGDVVNTAQRLQSAAEPGTVVVGPATYAATKDCIAYRDLGLLRAKGRDELVEAWVAVEPLLPPGYRRRRVQTPFVGRDAEVVLLVQAVAAAIERDRAHLLLVFGEAGVGKSRLTEEVANRAACEHDTVVLEGRCVPYGEANVWWPIAEALRQATRISADENLADADRLCTESVSAALGLPERSPEVKRVVNGLLFLMGFDVSLRGIDPQRAREEASRSVLTFVEGAARRRPVLLVLSDLHWADDVVLEMVRELLDRLTRIPITIAATARPEILDRFTVPAGRHNTVVVNLDPLDRDSTSVLLDSLTEGEVSADLRQALLDRSGGNPFFLEELVALVAEGELTDAPAGAPDADGQRGPARGLLDLPDTLRGLVAARVDALPDAERRVLEDASVWGRSGPVEAIDRMAHSIHGITDLRPILAGLHDKDVLVVEGDRWRFRSDLLREVAYGTLTKGDRARRHCGIASYLEHSVGSVQDADDRTADVVAYHYAAAAELLADIGSIEGLPDDVHAKALLWIGEAAGRAQVVLLHPVAVRLFGQGLRLVGDAPSPTRARLLLGRARSRVELRELDTARFDIEEAMSIAADLGDDELGTRALLALGEFEQKSGQLDAALSTLRAAVEGFHALGDAKGKADALRALGVTELFHGLNEEAEQSISEALQAYGSVGDRRGEAWALQNLAWNSYIRGRVDEASQRLSASADLFTELNDSGGLLWALGLMGFVKYHQGQFAEAEDVGGQVLIEARQRGDRWGEGMMLLLISGVRLWSGRTGAAITASRDALHVFRSIGDSFAEAQALAFLGRAQTAVGDVGEGLHILQEAVDGFGTSRQLHELREVLAGSLAGAAVAVGDPELALRAIGGVGHDDLAAHTIGDTDLLVARGLSFLQRGEVEHAIDALLTLVDDTPDVEAPPYARAALALALAVGGQAAEAETLVGEVVEHQRATYADRMLARIARCIGLARSGADQVRIDTALDDLVSEVAGVEDEVAATVVAMSRAAVLGALGREGAAVADERARARLVALGVDAAGWQRLLKLGLHGVAVAAGGSVTP